MATLSVQTVPLAALSATFATAAALGDDFVCADDERTFIWVKNGHSGSQNVIVAMPSANNSGQVARYGPVTLAANTISIPAGEERLIPVPPVFIDTDGKVDLTYSGVTLLTIAIIRLARLSPA